MKFELVGAWAGLLGGLSGTLALYLQLRTFLVTKPRVRTSIGFAYSAQTGEEFLEIQVTNSGLAPISINAVSVAYADSSHTPLSMFDRNLTLGPSLNHRLEGHSSVSWTVPISGVKSKIVESKLPPIVRGKIVLGTNKVLYSKNLTVQN